MIQNEICLFCNALRLDLHLPFGGTVDGKKMGARSAWRGLSMGMVYVGIRGRLNSIMEVNDSVNL